MIKLGAFKVLSEYIVSASDDIVDKTHYMFTSIVLLFCALLVGTKQTYGTPMQCITSASFPGEWTSYVNSYCFISGTYVSNATRDVMPEGPLLEHDKINIGYYQWVPYILICQSVMFFLPHLLWNLAQKYSDLDFNHLVEECSKLHEIDSKEKKEDKLKAIVNLLYSVVKYRSSRCAGCLTGTIGFFAYFFSKLLHVANVFVQLAFLYHFVGREDFYWGFNILNGGLSGLSWNETGFFQRVSFCDFRQNVLGGTQDFTVQCLLMMNMLNEKLFVLFYFWFWFLIAFSIANLLYLAMFMNREFWKSNDRKFLLEVFGLDGELFIYFIRHSTSVLDVSKILSDLHSLCAKTGLADKEDNSKPKKVNFANDEKSEEEKEEHFYERNYKLRSNPNGNRFFSGYNWNV